MRISLRRWKPRMITDTQVATQADAYVTDKETLIFERIISFCDAPRSTKEMTEGLRHFAECYAEYYK